MLHLLSRLFRRRSRDQVRVRLTMEYGPPVLLGPMDRFTADLVIVNRISPQPFYGQRRVISARIIGPE